MIYNNGTVALLTAGQNIEIHAIYNSSINSFTVSSITFLPPPPSANQLQLTGVVTSVSPSSGTVTSFVVHGLSINVGTASVVTPSGATANLAVGDKVAVTVQTSTGNTLTAVKILVSPVNE